MTTNNGVLGRFHFGGEPAHTADHPAVLLTGVKKTGTADYEAGLLLARDGTGALIPWDGTGAPVGVCDVPAAAGDGLCTYLAHGTVKTRLLKKGTAAADPADCLALHAIGIYPF